MPAYLNPPIPELMHHQEEIQNRLHEELNLVQQGKIQDAVLLQAMAHHWSPRHFAAVARSRGHHWRFMAALADATLEIQALGMIHLMSHIVGNHILINSVKKAIDTILRLQALQATYADNPRILALIETALDRAGELPAEISDNYWADLARLRR
jgi:hypothetical protein